MLHGRDHETATLEGLLGEARAGRAASLVVSAGPGLGKSALLEHVAGCAGDATVLRTAGLESESPLAFAALHRLLRPVLPHVGGLPAPQARALRVAFGERDGDRIDPFLVALATLSLLTEAAEASPVLCLVDDAHWLDAASADALLFAARRLLAERVAIVFATRDEAPRGFEAQGLTRMELTGLAPAAVGSLLREHAGQPLPDEVVARLAEATGGNPLALVELPGRLSPEQLAGTAGLPETTPMSARVERAFLDRCRRLSEPAQTLMLLASADDSGRLAVLEDAAAGLGLPPTALAEVEAAGLVTAEADVVRVRHPLVRSAVYRSATGAERRAAHAALGEALAGLGDLDRAVWHRASARAAPDPGVASALEDVGRRAEHRGGHDSAAAAYARAAQLTTEDAARARRLFAAARTTYAAGHAAEAVTLLDDAGLVADDPLLRADIARLRGRLQVVAGSAADGQRVLLRAAAEVAAVDQERAAYLAALAGIMRSHGVDSGAAVPEGVLDTAPRASDSLRFRCFKLLVRCTTADAEHDVRGATALLQDALAVGLETEDRDLWMNLANMALHLGDDRSHRRYLDTALSAARDEGAVMEVLYAQHRVGLSELAAGDWRAAHRTADDAISLARSVGQRGMTVAPMALRTLLASLEGDAESDALHDATAEALDQHHLGIMEPVVLDLLRWSSGTRAAHGGAPAEALHHFEQIQLPVIRRLAAQARIAAAANARETDLAAAWTTEIADHAEASGMAWAHAVADHGRALLAGPDAAGHLYETALEHHRLSGRRYDEACTRLAYGEHLRRSGRRIDARAQLDKALETFRDLRAEPLVARATRELRASGATARRRDPSTLVQLTPTELHVAQLVSEGLSNKDVAAQLWISPRTVAFHLRNVFSKTGVTSRGELARLDLS